MKLKAAFKFEIRDFLTTVFSVWCNDADQYYCHSGPAGV